MSGRVAPTLPDWDRLIQRAFLEMMPDTYEFFCDLFKRKPRVRVLVERQVPNEADL